MKTLSKILVAVWLLGAVDANAELKSLTLFRESQSGPINGFKKGNLSLEIKDGEILKPIYLSSSTTNLSPHIIYPNNAQFSCGRSITSGGGGIQ